MRKNSYLLIGAAFLALVSPVAPSQPVPAVRTVGDMAAVQSDTMMAKAETARAQALAELRRVSGSGEPGGLTAQQDSSLPQVKRIVEANGISEATLVYTNGKIDVREGDHIPGGFVVLHIKPDTSIVQLKAPSGRLINVPVSSDAGLSATPSSAGQVGFNSVATYMPVNAAAQPQQAPVTSRPGPLLSPSLADSSKATTH